MVGWIESVDQRTQLVGQNRLELLLFKLSGNQLYGINVFKVREVIMCPPIRKIASGHAALAGIAPIRDQTQVIVDIGQAMGMSPMSEQERKYVIITEYNGSMQGFLVSDVERIVNLNWENVLSPPDTAGCDNYLTAITHDNDRLVEIIDVEKVLVEIAPASPDYEFDNSLFNEVNADSLKIMIVDDSIVARKQVQGVVRNIGAAAETFTTGREALDHLKQLIAEGKDPCEEYLMIISDIEMPEMDGYTFTTEVRSNPAMNDLYIILHTSLSGVFNEAMVAKVEANHFISKFDPDLLIGAITDRVAALESAHN